MRWLDKAINFYTEWNENDKRKSSRFDISNESDFLRDYTGIRSVSIGLNYKGTDPYDSLISLLKNAKDIESLSIVGMKLSFDGFIQCLQECYSQEAIEEQGWFHS